MLSPRKYKSGYKKEIKQDEDPTVYTTEYLRKRNSTVKPWCALLQTQHQNLTLSYIDKSLSQNRHRVRGPTRGRAIKEESKVANRDWVDHPVYSLLQYINVITSILIMRNYFNNYESEQFSLIYTLSRHKMLVPKAPGAREI